MRKNPAIRNTGWRTFTAAMAIGACAVLVTAVPAAATGESQTVTKLPAKVTMAVGDTVLLTLTTNRTTGYSWQAEGGCCAAGDKSVVKVSKGKYTAPETKKNMVGAPGTTTWTITALRPGSTKVVVTTSPPGADNTMDDETVGTLTIKVKAAS